MRRDETRRGGTRRATAVAAWLGEARLDQAGRDALRQLRRGLARRDSTRRGETCYGSCDKLRRDETRRDETWLDRAIKKEVVDHEPGGLRLVEQEYGGKRIMKKEKTSYLFRVYLIRHKIKLTEAARGIGVSSRTISNWIHGKSEPNISAKEKLKKVLKFDWEKPKFLKKEDDFRAIFGVKLSLLAEFVRIARRDLREKGTIMGGIVAYLRKSPVPHRGNTGIFHRRDFRKKRLKSGRRKKGLKSGNDFQKNSEIG